MESLARARVASPVTDGQAGPIGTALILDRTSWSSRIVPALLQVGVPVMRLPSAAVLLAQCAAPGRCTVIVEWEVEGWNTLELIRSIKRFQPTARVIVVSAVASFNNTTAALRAGAYDFITIPVAPLLIIDAIGLQRHSPQCSLLTPQQQTLSLEQVKKALIEDTLREAGSVSAAARALGLDRRSLRRMAQRYAVLAAAPVPEVAHPSVEHARSGAAGFHGAARTQRYRDLCCCHEH